MKEEYNKLHTVENKVFFYLLFDKLIVFLKLNKKIIILFLIILDKYE